MHPVIIIIVVVMMVMMMMMMIIIIIIITITYLRPHGSKTHSGYKSENVYLSYRRSLIGQDRMSVVFQGGSWVSTGEVSSVFTRSWFRRHFFQQAGFRLVRSVYNESDGRVLHLPIRLINTPIFMLGTGVEGMTMKLIISLKPGTHGNKVEFNTVDFVENRLLPKPATNRQQIGNKVDCCRIRYVQLCCWFWQQIGNNLNSTVCRGRLRCRYVQLCCRYGRLCRQCVRGLTDVFRILYIRSIVDSTEVLCPLIDEIDILILGDRPSIVLSLDKM